MAIELSAEQRKEAIASIAPKRKPPTPRSS